MGAEEPPFPEAPPPAEAGESLSAGEPPPGVARPAAAGSVTIGSDGVARCAWGVEGDPLYRAYHDDEWGRPSRDERRLFEMLVLEGAQAGLSWSTILRKREGYRRAFAGFEVPAVAAFGEADVERLLADPGIVRNRRKVESAIASARIVLALADAGESLSDLVWAFVDGVPIDRRPAAVGAIPPETPASRAMSQELRRRGFRFVGPTICYAFMQATGLVNDHVVGCAAGDAIRVGGG